MSDKDNVCRYDVNKSRLKTMFTLISTKHGNVVSLFKFLLGSRMSYFCVRTNIPIIWKPFLNFKSTA